MQFRLRTLFLLFIVLWASLNIFEAYGGIAAFCIIGIAAFFGYM
jgi:hypothetical protein